MKKCILSLTGVNEGTEMRSREGLYPIYIYSILSYDCLLNHPRRHMSHTHTTCLINHA